MQEKVEQSQQAAPRNSSLESLELQANLNPEQKDYLEKLKAKMDKILQGKTTAQLAKAGNLETLKEYNAVLDEILEFLKTKEIKDNKTLSFKTIEELEAVYQPNQIAHNEAEVDKDTKVYIGALYPGIFDELKDVEHIYTSFPEGKIVQKKITIGGKTTQELQKELQSKGYYIGDYAKGIMENAKFKPAKNVEKIDLVILSVDDLGFPEGAVTKRQKIYEKALHLGLELVPPEVGPQLRLQYEDQPMNEWLNMGSETLAAVPQVVSGGPDVFGVIRDAHGSGLDGSGQGFVDGPWGGSTRWVFARPSSR